MSTLLIPDLDDDTLVRLRARAAGEGRSEAEEARHILEESLKDMSLPGRPNESLAEAMQGIFGPLGGHDFPVVRERGNWPPPDFLSPEFDPR